MPVFITECDKMSSLTVSVFFEKINYKVWQTEKVSQISKQLLQSVTKSYHKVRRIYYKIRQVLQCLTRGYYNVWEVLQNLTVITKWHVTTLHMVDDN